MFKLALFVDIVGTVYDIIFYYFIEIWIEPTQLKWPIKQVDHLKKKNGIISRTSLIMLGCIFYCDFSVTISKWTPRLFTYPTSKNHWLREHRISMTYLAFNIFNSLLTLFTNHCAGYHVLYPWGVCLIISIPQDPHEVFYGVHALLVHGVLWCISSACLKPPLDNALHQ